MAWADVVSNPDFQKLDPETQRGYADEYYSTRIATNPKFKSYSEEDKNSIKNELYSSIKSKPITQKQEDPGVFEDIVTGIKAAPAESLTYTATRALLGDKAPEIALRPGEEYRPKRFAGKVAQGVTTMLLDSPYYVGATIAAAPTGGASLTPVGAHISRTLSLMAPEFARDYTARIDSGEVNDSAESIVSASLKSALAASKSAVAMGVAPAVGGRVGSAVEGKLAGKAPEAIGKAAGFVSEKLAEGGTFSLSHADQGLNAENMAKSITEVALLGVLSKFGAKMPELGKRVKTEYGIAQIAKATDRPIAEVREKVATVEGQKELYDLAAENISKKSADITEKATGERPPEFKSDNIGITENIKARKLMEEQIAKDIESSESGDASPAIRQYINNEVNSAPLKPGVPETQTFKEGALRTIEYFTGGWKDRMSKYTDAGHQLRVMIENNKRNTDLFAGDQKNTVRKTWDLENFDKKVRSTMDEYVTDYLNNSREYAVTKLRERKIPVTLKDIQKGDIIARDMRSYLDSFLNTAKDTGLTEFVPSVRNWEIKPGEFGFEVKSRKGTEGIFETYQEAAAFKKSRMTRPIEAIENYYPRIIKWDVVKKRMPEIIDYLVKTNQVSVKRAKDVTIEKAMPDIERVVREEMRQQRVADSEARDSNLQYAREGFKMPDWAYERGRDAVIGYVERGAARIQRARDFGVRDERAYAKTLEIAREASKKHSPETAKAEALSALDLLNVELGKVRKDTTREAIANNIMGVLAVTKMTMSQLGQIPQMMAPIARTGPLHFAKAVKQIVSNPTEARALAERSGVIMESMREDIADGLGVKGAETWLKLVQFEKFDRFSRVLASVSGSFYAESLARQLKAYDVTDGTITKDGKRIEASRLGKAMEAPGRAISKLRGKEYGNAKDLQGEKSIGKIVRGDRTTFRQTFSKDKTIRSLQRLGLDPAEIIRRGRETGEYTLTDTERRTAARQVEVDTNFRAAASDLNEFRTTTVGKLMQQFKSFGFSQTKYIRDYMVSEFRYGNVYPLAAFLMVSGFGGAITKELRNAISGRDGLYQTVKNAEGDKKAEEVLTGLGEYLATAGFFGLGDMMLQSTKYGDPQFGALAGTIKKFFDATRSAQARKTNKEIPIVKFALGELPLGSVIKNRYSNYIKDKDQSDRYLNMTPSQFRKSEKRKYKIK